MNPVGIYYAYWTQEWDVDFLPFFAKVKRLGFDVLEINAGTAATATSALRRQWRQAALDHGVTLTFCVGLQPQHDVASRDEAVRRRGVAFLGDMIRGVAEAGGRTLGGINYGCWPGKLPAGADRNALIDQSVRSMREACTLAGEVGVTLCVEVVNRFEQYIMNTAAEAVDYVRRVDSPHCRILLDSFHLNIEEDSIAAAIESAGPWLGHFHIGETNRRAPGRGRMPWDEIFSTLHRAKYAGAITMEPFLMPGGQVGRDICVHRDLAMGVDLDDEAARACRFVRAKLLETADAGEQR
jgi:D-psicose/D-tagatose/L-ribulose 3-epimerase